MFTLRGPFAVALIGTLVIASGERPAAQTATADALFNDKVIHDVQLLVNTRDLRMLRERYLENVFVPADLVWQGIRVRNAGIRSRGAGSRNPIKLGFHLEFGRYTGGQQFLGMDSLVIDNLWQDRSLMREALAMSMFRRMGQAAPRESFARLFINGEYQGLYCLVENITTAFAATQTGNADGYLFEFHYQFPFYSQYLGDALAPYKPLFEPRSHQLDADNTIYGPIRDLFFEVNQPDDAVWRERVDARIDLAQFVTHVAIEGFLAQNDGILGYAGMNNFFMYRAAGSTRHRLFPWDQDFAFTFVESSILRRGEQPVILFDRALARPDLYELFLAVVETCVQRATEDDWLAAEIDRVTALITPAAFADTRKQYSNEEFITEVNFLRRFAAERPAIVLAEIAALRAPASPPDSIPEEPGDSNPPSEAR